MPPQNKTEQIQDGCVDLCRRPQDPAYTSLQGLSVWYDQLIDGTKDTVVAFTDDSGRFGEVYRTEPRNGNTTALHMTDFLYNYNQYTINGNGSFLDGSWQPPQLWTTAKDGSSYYYLTYNKMVREPLSGTSVTVIAWEIMANWYNSLVSVIPVSDRELMVVLSGSGEVLAFSGDPLGDKRLRHCTQDLLSNNSATARCDDISAKTHPHWFVRAVATQFARIAFSPEEGGYFIDWESIEGAPKSSGSSTYLLMSMEVFHQDRFRMNAIYGIQEDIALGDVVKMTAQPVAIADTIVCIATLLLAAVGVGALRQSQKSVELSSRLAARIATYDVEAAEALLNDAESSGGSAVLRENFKAIVANLRLYRPFLPQAILLETRSMKRRGSVHSKHGGKNRKSDAASGAGTSERRRGNEAGIGADKGAGSKKQGKQQAQMPPAVPSTSPAPSSLDAGVPVIEFPHAIAVPEAEPSSPIGTSDPNRMNDSASRSLSASIVSIHGGHSSGHRSSPSGEASAASKVAEIFEKLSSVKFKQVRGTVLLVDLGNLPTKDASVTSRYVKHFIRVASRVIASFSGVIDVLQANRILASFNYHFPIVKHEEQACRCANKLYEKFLTMKVLNVVISVSSGFNMVGNVGTERQMARVVVGEAVDLVCRLPPLQRWIGCPVMITDSTAQACPFIAIAVDHIQPTWHQTGRSQYVSLFQLTPKLGSGRTHPMTMIFSKLKLGDVIGAQSLLVDFLRKEPENPQVGRLKLIVDHAQNSAAPPAAAGNSPGLKLANSSLSTSSHPEQLTPRGASSPLGGMEGSVVRHELGWEILEGPTYKPIPLHPAQSAPAPAPAAPNGDSRTTPQTAAASVHSPNGDPGATNPATDPHASTGDDLVAFNALAAISIRAGGGDGDDGQGGDFGRHSPTDPVKDVDNARAKLEVMKKQRDTEAQEKMLTEGEGMLFGVFVVQDSAGVDQKDGQSASDVETTARNSGSASTSAELSEFIDVKGGKWIRSSTVVGKGAYGEVFLVIGSMGELCAAKVFSLQDSTLNNVETLVKEVEILSEYQHEHLAGYVSCAITPNNFVIIMEYLAAGSLRWLISSVKRLPPSAVRKDIVDVTRGLAYLHDRGVVHCDIKPDNILLMGDGTCKLADFGTAKFMVGGREGAETVRGTPRYMSPEAALGEWTTAADIYSLGLVMVEMLIGHSPWEHVKGSDTTFLLRLSQDKTMAPLLPEGEDMIPSDLRQTALRCLSRDPLARPTALQLIIMLQ